MSLGSVTDTNTVSRTTAAEPTTDTTAAAAPDKTAPTDDPKKPAGADVVSAARKMMSGVEDAIKKALEGVPGGTKEPLDGTELAGGKPTRPCGRGGRCTAYSPTRGLNPTSELA